MGRDARAAQHPARPRMPGLRPQGGPARDGSLSDLAMRRVQRSLSSVSTRPHGRKEQQVTPIQPGPEDPASAQ
jgi:hypothetical protein